MQWRKEWPIYLWLISISLYSRPFYPRRENLGAKSMTMEVSCWTLHLSMWHTVEFSQGWGVLQRLYRPSRLLYKRWQRYWLTKNLKWWVHIKLITTTDSCGVNFRVNLRKVSLSFYREGIDPLSSHLIYEVLFYSIYFLEQWVKLNWTNCWL